MKINNKGFAISSIMYIILVMAVIVMIATLAILNSRSLIINKLKDEALNDIVKPRIFTVTYTNIKKNDLPVNIVEGKSLEIDLTGEDIPSTHLNIKIDGEDLDETLYTYEDDKLILNNVKGNVEVIGPVRYSIVYKDIDSTNLPTRIIENETLTVDFTGHNIDTIRVKKNNLSLYWFSGYSYSNNVLKIEDVDGNIEIEEADFSKDSWETIVTNVQNGNISNYEVGDEKKITLTGDVAGTYIVRIANTTSDDPVCSNDNYSKTACGFVIEFVDAITKHNMNSTNTNVGGWKASELRKYVTPVKDEDGNLIEGSGTIYNALPEEIKNAVIDTTVVSGYGSTEGEENFVTTDKLYLLSYTEVFGSTSSDTAASLTRGLDYYNLTRTIFSLVKKNFDWWLRSADLESDKFYYVSIGSPKSDVATNIRGVAPAFRIG